MFKFSNRSNINMIGVNHQLRFIFVEALKTCPIDFGIPGDGGVRTAKRQNQLYLDPEVSTNCDGYEKKSKHQIGKGQGGQALDFYAYVNGRASWAEHHIAMIASVILATAKRLYLEGLVTIRLVWGATFNSNNFSGWDACHIEVA